MAIIKFWCLYRQRMTTLKVMFFISAVWYLVELRLYHRKAITSYGSFDLDMSQNKSHHMGQTIIHCAINPYT